MFREYGFDTAYEAYTPLTVFCLFVHAVADFGESEVSKRGPRFAFDGAERIDSATSQRIWEPYAKPVPGPEFEELGGVGVPWNVSKTLRKERLIGFGWLAGICSSNF